MSPVPGAIKAGAPQIARFARFCNHAGSSCGVRGVLDELYCALVQRLHETWRNMNDASGVTLMDFPKALKEVHGANATFWRCQHDNLQELQALRVGPRNLGSSELQDTERNGVQSRGSYQPPSVPVAPPVHPHTKPWGNAGPIAKPLVDVDLDIIFAELGLSDVGSSCKESPHLHDVATNPSSSSAEDLNAFLDRCLTMGPL